MDYKKKYLKYKNKYLRIRNKLTGGMDMGDFNEEKKKTSKLLNPWAKTFVQKTKKPLNPWAKTFVKNTKKPAEEEKKTSYKPKIDNLIFLPSWKKQLLRYWGEEINKKEFGGFSNFISYWKEQLREVIKYKIGSEVRIKETNETGIIIAETKDEGNGVIYYVVKLDNGKNIPVENVDLEFKNLSDNLALLPVDDLDFECYLDKIKPTNTLVITTHNLGGQTKYLDKNNKKYLTEKRGRMVENGDGYFLIEELNANLPVPILDPEVDVHLYQEWQKQCNIGERDFDLAINMRKKYFNGPDYSSRLGNSARTLDCPPIYLIDTEENEYIRTLSIINIHNMIVSNTSSRGQIDRLIEILTYIQMRHNNNPNLIIGGDFNFDFFNIEKELNILKETLTKSLKKQVKKEAEYLETILEPLYRYINENFILFPNKGEITNVWSLKDGEEDRKGVDYIIISKNLEECIDLDETIYEVDQSKIGASLFDEKAIFFKNDFDHAIVKLKIVWKDNYRVVY